MRNAHAGKRTVVDEAAATRRAAVLEYRQANPFGRGAIDGQASTLQERFGHIDTVDSDHASGAIQDRASTFSLNLSRRARNAQSTG